jgi:hypothetical protein
MKIDDTKMIAKLHASVCGRVSSMATIVRRIGMACVLACTAVAAMGPVQAQDRFRKDDLQQQPRDERGDRGDRNGQRFDQRDQRGDDAHRQQPDRNADAQRRSGRLTPPDQRGWRRPVPEHPTPLTPLTAATAATASGSWRRCCICASFWLRTVSDASNQQEMSPACPVLFANHLFNLDNMLR